ncbi:MAG: hypothetical protein OXH12_09525 [Chloroflexi bacterium]|nr:hypothetical protein [Chloroflexota bacterium]MCY3603305.1 hypothetical protein [Chloroflexota bacterium]
MKDARDLTPEEAAKRLREIMYAGSSNRASLNTEPMKRAIRELSERAAEAEPLEASAEVVVTSHGVGRGALFAGLALLVLIGGIAAAIVLG